MTPSDPSLSVRALTRAVARGDAHAVARVYESRVAMVYGVARRAGFDDQRALDVVQDTFIKAIRGMPVITSDASLDAWLRRIALRTALDAIRAEKRRKTREARSGAAPATDTRDVERLAELRRELAALDPGALDLLRLRHAAGFTLDAIARHLGTTPGAVDGHLRRSSARLRSNLEENDS